MWDLVAAQALVALTPIRAQESAAWVAVAVPWVVAVVLTAQIRVHQPMAPKEATAVLLLPIADLLTADLHRQAVLIAAAAVAAVAAVLVVAPLVAVAAVLVAPSVEEVVADNFMFYFSTV